MRNLIKKILRESDEWDWARDTEPSYMEVLKDATENDPRINIILNDDGELKEINDESGFSYVSKWDVEHLHDYEGGFTEYDLLNAIVAKIENDIWEWESRNTENFLRRNEDYQDFLHLRDTINKLFF